GLARRYGLRPGSALRLRVQDRRGTVFVLGLVTPAAGDLATALDGFVFMDVGAAPRHLRVESRPTPIDLLATGNQTQPRPRPPRPAAPRLEPARESAEALSQLTSAFSLNLTALSLLAIVVGMFLIYNTVMFSVVQRRAVLGTLRSLGVTPLQVFALVLAETA